ncbi:hypothetical protein FRC00_001672 [Tulasnella sp. 408]|nr:hypothetical protein FRC00_001672 [Tulasnella sp. 408]
MTRLRVPAFNLGQNLGINDMMKPEYAEYFAQFKDVPDDPDPQIMQQRGFKPPEYFAKKYFEGLATKTSDPSFIGAAQAVEPQLAPVSGHHVPLLPSPSLPRSLAPQNPATTPLPESEST